MQPAQNIIDAVTANLGFEVKPSATHAEEVPMGQEFMPFFNRSAEDESTWKNSETTVRVDFDHLNVITLRSGKARFPNITSLSAILNPHTQQVLKITSAWPAGIEPIAPFPDAPEEERQLINKGERFVSLPAAQPPVDFFSALKQLDLLGPVSPRKAKQVIAYLVNQATIRYASRPVWIIQTRGIDLVSEGYSAQPGSVPVDARNHMRSVVDATTGEWLYSDTAPQPVNR